MNNHDLALQPFQGRIFLVFRRVALALIELFRGGFKLDLRATETNLCLSAPLAIRSVSGTVNDF